VANRPFTTKTRLRYGAALTLLVVSWATLHLWQPSRFVIVNLSPSVPVGIYMRAEPDDAEYLSFCVSQADIEAGRAGERFCTVEGKKGVTILKRIHTRRSDGSYWVLGDHTRALDSRSLGWIKRKQTVEFWKSHRTLN
jgi:hypothetical protein